MVHRIKLLLDSCCLMLAFNNRLQLHESLFDGWFTAHMIMKYVSLVQSLLVQRGGSLWSILKLTHVSCLCEHEKRCV